MGPHVTVRKDGASQHKRQGAGLEAGRGASAHYNHNALVQSLPSPLALTLKELLHFCTSASAAAKER